MRTDNVVKGETSFGEALRAWRLRRRSSQLELALEAEVSSRHVSFVETGRAKPSREMVLRLAECLGIPLRERNRLLGLAGFAAAFSERSNEPIAADDVRAAVELVVNGHAPHPALAVDRHWHMVLANAAVMPLLTGVDRALLEPPINVLRLSLHPHGLAPAIHNLAQWRRHLLHRLRHQADASGDAELVDLLRELEAYPSRSAGRAIEEPVGGGLGGAVIPLRLETALGTLSLFSATTVFGTPLDVGLSELAIEAFYPADAATAALLRNSADAQAGRSSAAALA